MAAALEEARARGGGAAGRRRAGQGRRSPRAGRARAAEAEAPGQGGDITRDTINRAAELEYTLDCWRALPEHGEGLGLPRRNQVLNRTVAKLAAWLDERPDHKATRREIQQARVAGKAQGQRSGRAAGRLRGHLPRLGDQGRAGRRRSADHHRDRSEQISVLSPVNTEICTDVNPHIRAISGGVVSGNTASGNTASGDTAAQLSISEEAT